jgi:succinyl-CoA synthetase beta subunit
MNLHEYQGKELLSRFNIKVQRGITANNLDEAHLAYQKLLEETQTKFVVVKAQIHAGGRGKGGGVKLAKSEEEFKNHAASILGMHLKTPQTPGGLEGPGKLVNKILIAEDSYAPDFNACKEYYFSILTDRSNQKNVIIYSTQGGMDIEKVAEETPELVHKEYVDPALGLLDFQARKIAFNLALSGNAFKEMIRFTKSLYEAYVKLDLNLLEMHYSDMLKLKQCVIYRKKILLRLRRVNLTLIMLN